MRGYRYFVAGRYLFYYSVSSAEIRVAAIIPAAMRLADRPLQQAFTWAVPPEFPDLEHARSRGRILRCPNQRGNHL